jgi:hypothetical protein
MTGALADELKRCTNPLLCKHVKYGGGQQCTACADITQPTCSTASLSCCLLPAQVTCRLPGGVLPAPPCNSSLGATHPAHAQQQGLQHVHLQRHGRTQGRTPQNNTFRHTAGVRAHSAWDMLDASQCTCRAAGSFGFMLK